MTDAEISFPYQTHEKISTALLVVCGLVIPGVIIFLISVSLVPGPTVCKATPKTLIWRRKLWEWHTGWLGLGLSLAAAFLITNGMKNLFGKPRPDLLSRCDPDVTNIAQYTFESFQNVPNGFSVVSAEICQQTDKSILDDGFRSFPSGHASFSAAGLLYLGLFIASKLAITIPFLAPSAYSQDASRFSAFPSRAERRAVQTQAADNHKEGQVENEPLQEQTGHNNAIIAARNQAAAPPVYLLVFATVPFFASVYVASTRYSDFRHHGFDILFGYFIGTVTAVFAFRYYHLPISQGAGWSWGPRSRDRSFWAGVGVGNYVGSNESSSEVHDVETGQQENNDVGVVGNGEHVQS